jgi:hypothetical protein
MKTAPFEFEVESLMFDVDRAKPFMQHPLLYNPWDSRKRAAFTGGPYEAN